MGVEGGREGGRGRREVRQGGREGGWEVERLREVGEEEVREGGRCLSILYHAMYYEFRLAVIKRL